MIYRLSLNRFVLTLLMVLSFEPSAFSEDRQVPIDIFGLTLRCERCVKLSDNSCILNKGGANERSIRCSNALEILLTKRSEEPYDNSFPSDIELRRFLLRKDWDREIAYPALKLFLQTDFGQKVVVAEVARFYDRYRDEMYDLIDAGVCSDKVLKAFWDLKVTDGIILEAKIRGLIASVLPGIDLKELFVTVNTIRPRKSIAELEKLSEVVRERKPEWSKALFAAKTWVERCGKPFKSKEFPKDCLPDARSKMSVELQGYLSRFEHDYRFKYLSSRDLPAKEVIDSLVLLKADSFIAPDVSKLVAKSMRTALNGSDKDLDIFLRSDVLELSFQLSKEAPEVAQLVGIILSKRARKLLAQDDFDGALSLLENSYTVFPQLISERTDLLYDLIHYPIANTDEKIKARLLVLRNKDGALSKAYAEHQRMIDEAARQAEAASRLAGGDSRRSLSKKIVVYLLSSVLVIGLIYFMLRDFLKRQSNLGKEFRKLQPLEIIEVRELGHVLQEFGLPVSASYQQLEAAYQKIAGKFDLNQGGSAEDQKIHKNWEGKYRHASILIARRGKTPKRVIKAALEK